MSVVRVFACKAAYGTFSSGLVYKYTGNGVSLWSVLVNAKIFVYSLTRWISLKGKTCTSPGNPEEYQDSHCTPVALTVDLDAVSRQSTAACSRVLVTNLP